MLGKPATGVLHETSRIGHGRSLKLLKHIVSSLPLAPVLEPTSPRDMPNFSFLLIVVVGNDLVVKDLLSTPAESIGIARALYGY